MAQLRLSELLGTLLGSSLRAQLSAHAELREFVEVYASDEILRTFNVPGFEIDAVELTLPIQLSSLVQEAGDTATALAINVVAKRTRVPKSKRAKIADVLSDELGLNGADAATRVEAITKSVQLLATTNDEAFARRLANRLKRHGVRIDLQRLELDPCGDLMVDTEPTNTETATSVLVKIKPRAFRLIKDSSGEGSFILESAS